MAVMGEGSGKIKKGQRLAVDVDPARRVPQPALSKPVNVSTGKRK